MIGLVETLTLRVGPVIAKAILKVFLKDKGIALGSSEAVIDLLKSKTSDVLAQQHAKRQFEEIGERVAQSLEPVFEADGFNIKEKESSFKAITLALAETIEAAQITSELLAQKDLDPAKLAGHMKSSNPQVSLHFGEDETYLYERLISEASQRIVDVASRLPTFNERTLSEVLRRENQLLSTTATVLEEVRRIWSGTRSSNFEAAAFERDYRFAVLRRLDQLELFGIDVSSPRRRHSLSVAYISLLVEQRVADRDDRTAATSLYGRPTGDKDQRAPGDSGDAELDEESVKLERRQERIILPVEEALAISDRRMAYRSEGLLDWRKRVDEKQIELGDREITSKRPGRDLRNVKRLEGNEGVDDSVEARMARQGLRSVVFSRCRLLIRGPAGAGKTTLLQWIAVRAASQTFKGALIGWNECVPFFIRLRQFADSDMPAPEYFPRFIAPMITATMPHHWVHDELRSGRALVLVDGVDEVRESQRKAVREWLKDLVETYPSSRFIVTSRPTAVDEDWMTKEGFRAADLQSMDMQGSLEFIDHWEDAVSAELEDEEEKDELKRLAVDLKREIKSNHSVLSLAINPLLCAMICALYRDHHRRLPSDRIDLYEACCKALLERRDKERSIQLADYPNLSYGQKRALLEDLAYWLLLNGWSVITKEKAEDHLAKKVASMRGLRRATTARDVLRLFIDRSGLMREPQSGEVGFTHLTFQEFLAARSAIDKGDTGVLISNSHKNQWREVIILATGSAIQAVREEIIQGLIRRGDEENDHRRRLFLLAVSCLETSVVLATEVEQEVERRLTQLVPPRNMWEAKELASAGEIVIPYLDYSGVGDRTIAAACIRTLAHIGTEGALSMLERYGVDESESVLSELLRAWYQFDDAEFARRVFPWTTLPRAMVNRIPIDRIQYITSLVSLDLSASNNREGRMNLDALANLVNLTSLSLASVTQVDDIKPLAALHSLTSLDLSSCVRIKDLSPLASLRELTHLNLSGCSTLQDLSVLTKLTPLSSLDISFCREVVDLGPIGSLSGLTTLNIRGCAKVADVSALRNLTHLSSVDMSYCVGLRDISPISNLQNLLTADISYCDGIEDLTALVNLPKLSSISVFGLYKSEVEKMRKFLPQTHFLPYDLS